ncbi:oligosaccharide flippase family protein [soil metagenome]
MSNIKKLAGETAVYGLSSIVGRLLNYLLVPIYTRVFVPEEYGIVTELYAYAAFFNVIYTYGMETAYFRFASRSTEEEIKIFNVSTTSLLISSIFFSFLLIVFSTPIVNALNYQGREYYIIWLALILAIDAIMAVPFAKLRLEKKALQFATAKLVNIGLNLGLNLFFIVFSRNIYEGNILQELKPYILWVYNPAFGVEYVFISNLIANAMLFFLLWKVIKRIRLEFDWNFLKPMLIYAYPLLFMGLAGTTNEMLSRAMLKYLLPEGFYGDQSNLAALGVFGACYKLSVFMTLAIQAFRYASEPFFFSKAQDKQSPQLFSKVMHWFVIVCCFIFLGVSINIDIIGLLLGMPEYREGLYVVPILLLANLFLGIYFNLSIWFKLTDNTHYGTWISFGGAAITIIFNIILIPVLGYLGSALVTLLCYFSMSVASYILGNKFYPIPYGLKTSLAYITGTAIIVYLVLSVKIDSQFIATSFHFFVLALYVILVVMLEKIYLKFNRI